MLPTPLTASLAPTGCSLFTVTWANSFCSSLFSGSFLTSPAPYVEGRGSELLLVLQSPGSDAPFPVKLSPTFPSCPLWETFCPFCPAPAKQGYLLCPALSCSKVLEGNPGLQREPWTRKVHPALCRSEQAFGPGVGWFTGGTIILPGLGFCPSRSLRQASGGVLVGRRWWASRSLCGPWSTAVARVSDSESVHG